MSKNKFIGQIREYNPYAEHSVKEAFKLDLLDKKILYLLGENSRLSNTYLAKKLKIKRETVAYRIKRMKEANFLHGYLTLLNHRKLGFKNYLVYIKLKTLTDEKELLDYLFNFNEITRLKNCSGKYDLQVIYSVTNSEDFLTGFEKLTDKYHHLIESYDVLEIIDEDFLGLQLLLNKEESKKLTSLEQKGSTFQKEFIHAEKETDKINLDKKDKEIVNELKLDGGVTIRALSEKVSLAPIAVENRIKKLVRSGVIKRFMPLASLNQLGYQWWKVFFKFKNLDKKKFFTFLKYHSNVLWYMRLLGKWDYQFSIFAKDNAEFHRILDEIRSEFSENIISYDSIIVFNQFKFNQLVD